ncbi:MAG: hypothetical protein IPG90_22045 [Bacteroidetes bacterium]|nr:hypothetical protein [Bacteroidota bacterium]
MLAHAELDTKHNGLKAFDEDPESYKAFLASRPRIWEDEAVKELIALCEKTKSSCACCSSFFFRFDCTDSSRTYKRASIHRRNLSALLSFFDAESIPDGDTRYKCTPHSRKRKQCKIMAGLKNGVLDFVVTDHSPAPPEIKEIESGNLKEALGEEFLPFNFHYPSFGQSLCVIKLRLQMYPTG